MSHRSPSGTTQSQSTRNQGAISHNHHPLSQMILKVFRQVLRRQVMEELGEQLSGPMCILWHDMVRVLEAAPVKVGV